MPSGVAGADITYAFKKSAAAWGAAVALGAGDGFKAPAHNLKATYELQTDDSLGSAFATDATPGKIAVNGGVPPYLRYNDKVILTLLAMFMGTAAAPDLHAAGAISYDHTLKVARVTDGLFGTLAAKLGDKYVEEYPSFKPTRITLKIETGAPITLLIEGIADDLVTASETNTVATFANVTILEPANRAFAAQAVLRMNEQSAIALAAGDNVPYASIELVASRDLEGVYGSRVSAGAVPRELIDEPYPNGMWTSSLKVGLNRLTAASGDTALRTLTAQKAEIIITGAVIEGAIPYLFRVQLPHLKPKTNDAPHEKGRIKNAREYEVLGAVAAPLGMTGNTDPFWIFLTNKLSASLLA